MLFTELTDLRTNVNTFANKFHGDDGENKCGLELVNTVRVLIIKSLN